MVLGRRAWAGWWVGYAVEVFFHRVEVRFHWMELWLQGMEPLSRENLGCNCGRC